MPTRKLRVLFVDDDEVVRKTWDYCFGEEFEATTVPSASKALELLAHPPQGVPFDVLVADHRMPEMTGAELCWKAREIAPDTARIIVTAFRDRETALCPCSAVLEKPTTGDKLESMIRQLANGTSSDEDVRRRELEAEEALVDARARFRKTTEELRSWAPSNFPVKERA